MVRMINRVGLTINMKMTVSTSMTQRTGASCIRANGLHDFSKDNLFTGTVEAFLLQASVQMIIKIPTNRPAHSAKTESHNG